MRHQNEKIHVTQCAFSAIMEIWIGQMGQDIAQQENGRQGEGRKVGQTVNCHILGFNHPKGYQEQNSCGSVQHGMEKWQASEIVVTPLDFPCFRHQKQGSYCQWNSNGQASDEWHHESIVGMGCFLHGRLIDLHFHFSVLFHKYPDIVNELIHQIGFRNVVGSQGVAVILDSCSHDTFPVNQDS